MIRTWLLLAGILLIQMTKGQTLFTYGSHTVTKQEFLNAFNKNKTPSDNTVKGINDYLDLFIKFKLKVQAARDEKLDTLASQKYDLQNYSNQIQNGYLTDSAYLNLLVQQAVERSAYTLHLTYLFVPLDLADTLKSLQLAKSVFERLVSGKSLQEQLEIFKINSNIYYGDAGKITVFSIPYVLENIVYGLSPMSISTPFKGIDGFYIFQVTDKKKASIEKIKTAQILIALSPSAGNVEDEMAKRKADSIYNLLLTGASFSNLAKQNSDDRTTSGNGGVMDAYFPGKYIQEFDSHVFSLQRINDFTHPFKTSYGYHIVKLLEKDSTMYVAKKEMNITEIRQKVMEDERANIAKEKFISRAKEVEHFKWNSKINILLLKNFTDSFIAHYKKLNNISLNQNSILFSLKNSQLKLSDWYVYINNYRGSMNVTYLPPFQKLLNLFINDAVLNNYRMHLSEYNSAYKQEIKEYTEGNLLFNIMERKVWSNSSTDTSALFKFYDKRRLSYKWNKSIGATVYTCKDAEDANKIRTYLAAGGNNIDLLKQYPLLQVDSGRFELKQLPLRDPSKINENDLKDRSILIFNDVNNEHNSIVIKVTNVYPPGEIRTFDEARGMVVNDYQNYLEATWIKSLKKKYPVIINQPVFNNMIKELIQ